MDNIFPSKALEVNLAETRNDQNIISEEHLWFLSRSESYMGIHKQAEELIFEYNHSFINYDYVIESLYNVSISDLWFYCSLEESERALYIMTDMYKDLLCRNLVQSSKERLVIILIKFTDQLVKQKINANGIIHRCLFMISEDFQKDYMTYIKISNYFKVYFSRLSGLSEFKDEVVSIIRNVLLKCLAFWQSSSDMDKWFPRGTALFQSDQMSSMSKAVGEFLNILMKKAESASDWQELSSLLFYNDIAEHLRKCSDMLNTNESRIYYLFCLLHHPGMSGLKNYLLYDINRLLRYVFSEFDCQRAWSFVENIMDLFEELKTEHMETLLDCILTLGKEVINTKEKNLISSYVKRLIRLGFVHPGKLNINDDWQIEVDKNHIKNIRVWLELIEYSPLDMKELLSSLIINLKLGGIFISDTDLFQRDVTKLLNSNLSPVYKQIKQLTRIFPVYFKEIGAEGKLREVTTSLDELCHRKDKLIHFLRKQIHTESNNTHIELSKKILQFWYDGDLAPLKQSLPPDVLESIDKNNIYFTGVHIITGELCGMKGLKPSELLNFTDKELEIMLNRLSDYNESDKKRVHYLIQLHKLILEKYSLESGSIVSILKCSNFFKDSDIVKLEDCLSRNDMKKSLPMIFKFMHILKKIILNPANSEPIENIYYKRHIAFGIPSMYGQYVEPKFEALGIMFRMERVASRAMEIIVRSVNLKYITAKTLKNIYRILKMFKDGIELDGIENQGFSSNLQMLKYGLSSPNFSFDQYINIFRFMAQNVKEIINEYFLRVYDGQLRTIIPMLLCRKDTITDNIRKQLIQRESEIFYRDILSSAFLIQQLDNFISNIVIALQAMADSYTGEFIRKIMTYNSDLIISPLYKETQAMDNPVFIGAKAFYLKKLTSYSFPVPPGFVLTTEFFNHKNTVLNHPYINNELNQMVEDNIRKLEKLSSRKFGDINSPLLFSVRSGTAISMPGAMSTFLNVGINDQIVEGMSKQPNMAWAAYDCYRRFIQSWGMAHGIDRDIFDSVILEHKIKCGVEQKMHFTAEQMKNIADSYKDILYDHGIKIEYNPFLQLKEAIINVIESWYLPRAKSFREHLQIAGEWGTAVIVQKMVFGNISSISGSGVIFTHNPKHNTPGVNLYGDFTLKSQGEDIVSGLVHTLPVTECQRKEYFNGCSISLEKSFPLIYKRLLDLSSQLVDRYGFNHQEIEFTFESDSPDSLYILQTRDQKIGEKRKTPVFSLPPDKMNLVGRGIGIGGGALFGILSFGMEDLQNNIKIYPEKRQIVVRPDTVPDDIPMAFICDGLITSRGGATSHAAVTASSLGKVCIVNCLDLNVNEQKKTCTFGNTIFKSGDMISIDGTLGNIYSGSYPIEYV